MALFNGEKTGQRNARAVHSKRRRLRKEAAKSYGNVDRMDVYEFNNGLCHICGLPVPKESFHVEHAKALANGGDDTWRNLRVAHPRCNLEKGARTGPRKKGLQRRKPMRCKRKVRDDREVW